MTVREITDINMLVPFYLMSSYLYYDCNISPISDSDYDYICKTLLEHYDEITHFHKEYLDKEALDSGTAYHIKWDKMPNRIKSAAMNWYYDKKAKIPEQLKKREDMKIRQPVIVLSAADMDSIFAAKILCKAIPDSIHMSSSKKNIDLPSGSLIYLIRPYMGAKRILTLLDNYEIHLIDFNVSNEYKDRQFLEQTRCKTTWVDSNNTLSETVWKMFNKDNVPQIINYVRDYMKWEFNFEESVPIFYAYEILAPKFGSSNDKLFNDLLDNNQEAIDGMLKIGTDVQKYVDYIYNQHSQELTFSSVIDDIPVIAANISGVNSLFFSRLNMLEIGNFDIAMMFYFVPSINSIHSSIYAINPDINVGEIATKYNGGGNKGAAGFTTDVLPFNKLTTTKVVYPNYEEIIKASLNSSYIIQYVKTKIHGYQRNAFYGTWRNKKAVFYNTPFLVATDFFENIDTRECEITVCFCMLADGMYRIACKNTNGVLLPDEFGKKADTYSIEILPELVYAKFAYPDIRKDILFKK